MRSLFLFAVWVVGATANLLAAADRTFTLPCEIGSFSPSGDGTTVWIECFELPAEGKPSPEFAYQKTSAAYALDTTSGQSTDLVHSMGPIFITAAPVGAKAVIALTAANTDNTPTLYDRSGKIASLPAEVSYPSWTPDAKKLMFLAGPPADGSPLPKSLGIVNLDSLAISKVKLAVPTELLFTCRQNGHLFTGNIAVDRSGHLKIAGTDEYGPDLRYLGRNARTPPGTFSATCRYVATPSSFHGPVPWEIVDTATGRQVLYFDFTAEGKKIEYAFGSWNPQREAMFLRTAHLAGDPRDEQATLQIFDLRSRRVVESMPISSASPEAQWSADGNWLIVARGRSLIFHAIPN